MAAARPGQILTTALVRVVAGGRGRGWRSPTSAVRAQGPPRAGAGLRGGLGAGAERAAALPLPALLRRRAGSSSGATTELEQLARLWKEVVGRRPAPGAPRPGSRASARPAWPPTWPRRSTSDGAVVLAGRCDEDLGVPYQPFVEALRHYVDPRPPSPASGRYAGRAGPARPRAGRRWSPGSPRPLRSDPETERYRLFDAVAAWLADVSADAPGARSCSTTSTGRPSRPCCCCATCCARPTRPAAGGRHLPGHRTSAGATR